MLREEKIRKMIRLSDYENGQGSTDLKRTHYTKADYVRLQLLKTAVAVATAGFLLLLLVAMCHLDYWMVHFFEIPFRRIMIPAGVGLVLTEVVALVVTGRMAKRQYEEAALRVREYDATLQELLALYEEEEQEESAL